MQYLFAEMNECMQGGPSPLPGGHREPIDAMHARLMAEWSTEPGQVWEIPSNATPGRSHRIACGDCRDRATLARLALGGKVAGCVTSPPYANQRKAQYGGIDPRDYVAWFELVQDNIRRLLAPDGSFFLNIDTFSRDGEDDLYVHELVIAMRRDWRWKYITTLCWERNGPPGKFLNRFKSGWEPVYHFALNARLKFRPWNVAHASDRCVGQGDRRARASGSGFGCPNEETAGLALPSDVIRSAPANVPGHSAAFPTELPERVIRAYSDPGDSWFDPFIGSGSTLIACEANGRLCLGSELSPAHVAVLLDRCRSAGLDPIRSS